MFTMMTYQQKTSTWKVLAFVIVAFVALSPTLAMAQYTPLAPLPCVPGNGVTCPGGAGNTVNDIEFETYVQYAFNLIIAIAAAAAIFMIVVGGFQYMTTDSWSGKSAGLDKARNAVYGLILVLTSFILLRTIDPRLVNIKTTLVTPLEINYEELNNDLSGFYAQLQKDAVTYGVDISKFKQNIQQASEATQVSTLAIANITDEIIDAWETMGGTSISRDEVDDLCATAYSPDSEGARLASLCQELRQKREAKATAESTVVLNTAQAAIRMSVHQCGSTANPECFQNKGVAASISGILAKYSSALQPAQKQQLESYADYSQVVVNINLTAVNPNYNLGYKITQIDNLVKEYASKPTVDNDLLRELKDYQSKVYKENLDYTPPPKS